MQESERERYKRTRSIRMGERWEQLAETYGDRKRAALFEQFAAWMLREPGARLPKRADHQSQHTPAA